jgi:hypothetical protein
VSRAQWLRLALALALAAGVALVVGLREHIEVAELEAKVHALGPWAPLAFAWCRAA